MQRHPRRTRWIIRLVFMLVLFGVGEFSVRSMGFKPGWLYRGWFIKEVDSLKVLQGYQTDERGITVIDTALCEGIEQRIRDRYIITPDDRQLWYEEGNLSGEVSLLSDSYVKLLDKEAQWPFAQEIQRIQSIPHSQRSAFEQMLWHFAFHPVNDYGFHSIPFQRHDPSRRSILLLGDSFMYGKTCDNYTQSTAHLLLAKGYEVWNTGISATDPAQYLAIAQWLIPALHPDYVVIEFYLGNDVFYYCREVSPDKPLLYETNAGIVFASPEGVFLPDPQMAYDHMIARHMMPNRDAYFLNRVMSWSAGTTQLWLIMRNNGFFKNQLHPEPFPGYQKQVDAVKTDYPCSLNDIKEIFRIAKENGAEPIMSIIPVKGSQSQDPISELPELSQFPYIYPPNLSRSDYHEDGHYVASGHQKNAEILLKNIKPPLK